MGNQQKVAIIKLIVLISVKNCKKTPKDYNL